MKSTKFESMRQRIANQPDSVALTGANGEQFTNSQVFQEV
jgi:hypothetical protein